MLYLCHMLHSSSSQTQFLSISFLSIIFGWFCMCFCCCGKMANICIVQPTKKNYQNIHLDHKGLSWKNKRCILLRMKYSIWYRQFNGISFGFGLELLFGTKINICTGIMRIIQLQIYSSLLCRHIPHVQATYPIPLLFWAWFSQLLLSSFFLFWRLWRLAQECGVHRNS